jgi:hypothetical protein
VVWPDDTPVTALGGEEPGSLTARFWLYHGDEDHPYDVYDFTTSRRRDGPATFLAGFAGYLQADAYSGYDGLYLGSPAAIHEVACWAHARRKFYDARQRAAGGEPGAGMDPAALRRGGPRPRRVSRRASIPPPAGVGADPRSDRESLDEWSPRILPKSALGKALTYARNQRAALRRYVTDGRLTIDNNVSERTLRPQAVGRNYAQFPIMRSHHHRTSQNHDITAVRSVMMGESVGIIRRTLWDVDLKGSGGHVLWGAAARRSNANNYESREWCRSRSGAPTRKVMGSIFVASPADYAERYGGRTAQSSTRLGRTSHNRELGIIDVTDKTQLARCP